jgi:non-specific riboncleoside hydrolase
MNLEMKIGYLRLWNVLENYFEPYDTRFNETKKDIEEIKNLGQAGEMLYSLFTHYRGGDLETTGLMMHDICTICYLLRPEIFEFQETYLEVALAGPAAGTTVADLAARYTDKKNVKLAVGIDQKQFRDWVVEEMKKLK